ncbi:holin [Caudoviricetes sp.]|nr:holin [Caudoviricetes sp.]
MLDLLVGPISKLLDKFIPDAGEKARLAHEIATLATKQAHENAMAQIEVNKAEAASGSLFKGGWRPFIGWTCGTAFAYHFVIQPLVVFILVVNGQPVPALPVFDMASLMTVLGGLLGLGTLRTFEKFKGVD